MRLTKSICLCIMFTDIIVLFEECNVKILEMDYSYSYFTSLSFFFKLFLLQAPSSSSSFFFKPLLLQASSSSSSFFFKLLLLQASSSSSSFFFKLFLLLNAAFLRKQRKQRQLTQITETACRKALKERNNFQ